MSALEYHHIDQILRKFDVTLPSQVVAALADAARRTSLGEYAEDSDAVSSPSSVPADVRTLDVLSVRPVVDGEAQPCLRAIIHGHFLRKRGERGREAGAKANKAAETYLAALVVPGKTAEDRHGTHCADSGAAGMSQGLACAAELCQDCVDSAENYQKRLAAFQCLKRIKDALAEYEGASPALRADTISSRKEAPVPVEPLTALPHAGLRPVAWQRRCMVNGSAITDWMLVPEACIEVELNLGNEVRELFPGPVIRTAPHTSQVSPRSRTASTVDLFGAQNRLLSWNRRQSKPPIAIGMEYSVAAAAVEALAGAQE